MNNISMAVLSLTLPIIFMLHDFEEIIMVNAWQKKYSKLLQKTPHKPFSHWISTASGTAAVLVGFLFYLTASAISIILNAYIIWYAAHFMLTAHFLLHYFLSIRFRNYTPGLSTSIVFMLPCLYILYIGAGRLRYPAETLVLVCLVSLAVIYPLFIWLTKMISVFAKWLSAYASHQKGSLNRWG